MVYSFMFLCYPLSILTMRKQPCPPFSIPGLDHLLFFFLFQPSELFHTSLHFSSSLTHPPHYSWGEGLWSVGLCAILGQCQNSKNSSTALCKKGRKEMNMGFVSRTETTTVINTTTILHWRVPSILGGYRKTCVHTHGCKYVKWQQNISSLGYLRLRDWHFNVKSEYRKKGGRNVKRLFFIFFFWFSHSKWNKHTESFPQFRM